MLIAIGAGVDKNEVCDGRRGGSGDRSGMGRSIDIANCYLERKVVENGSIDRAATAAAFDSAGPNGNYRCVWRETGCRLRGPRPRFVCGGC